jgi:hypothetical protein
VDAFSRWVNLVIGSTYLGTFPRMIMLGIGAGLAILSATASVRASD